MPSASIRSGTDTITMNQNIYHGYWNKLGTSDLVPNAGHNVKLSDRASNVVQAIRLVSAEGAERVARWEGTVANAGTYQVWARWPAAPTHAFAASYSIVTPGGTETLTVNQRIEGGRWHLLKTITLAANDNWQVELSDQTPGEVAEALGQIVTVPVPPPTPDELPPMVVCQSERPSSQISDASAPQSPGLLRESGPDSPPPSGSGIVVRAFQMRK